MTQRPSPRPQRNASLFIGLWLGLTLAAGLTVFGMIFWAMGGFDGDLLYDHFDTDADPSPAKVATEMTDLLVEAMRAIEAPVEQLERLGLA